MQKKYTIMLFQEITREVYPGGPLETVWLPTPFHAKVSISEDHFSLANCGAEFTCDALQEAQKMIDVILHPFGSLDSSTSGGRSTSPYTGLISRLLRRHAVRNQQEELTRDYAPRRHPSDIVPKTFVTRFGGPAALAIMEYEGIYDIGASTTRLVEVVPVTASLERVNQAFSDGEIYNAIVGK
jgi:hypothetical protein